MSQVINECVQPHLGGLMSCNSGVSQRCVCLSEREVVAKQQGYEGWVLLCLSIQDYGSKRFVYTTCINKGDNLFKLLISLWPDIMHACI